MDDIPLDGRRVIVRVDFNVSPGEDKMVDQTEDFRIEAALTTIQELRQRRCKVLLMAHLGRPGEDDSVLSMDAIARRLRDLLRDEVKMLPKLFGSQVDAMVQGMEAGDVALLPNVRLDAREMTLNEKFADELSTLGDIYINEAFSNSHRKHTSMVLLPQRLPSAAGRRTVLEVDVLSKLRGNPEHPYVAITSGAKITTKIGILKYLLSQVDFLCVGGKIANVFLAAQGTWPQEMFSADEIAVAKDMLETYGDKIIVPVDVVVGNDDGSYAQTIGVGYLPPHVGGIWDLGPESVKNILETCDTAKTIIWNGPLGKTEVDAYSGATKALIEGLASHGGYRVVGGGDTVNVLEKMNKVSSFDHVSVGGGAMIEFLEGKHMPGLEILQMK
jgi:phosphoglycerate kinase